MTKAKPALQPGIADQAALWVARLDAAGNNAELSGALRLDISAWMDGDPCRTGAFLRAEAAWHMMDGRTGALDVADAGLEQGPQPQGEENQDNIPVAGAEGVDEDVVPAKHADGGDSQLHQPATAATVALDTPMSSSRRIVLRGGVAAAVAALAFIVTPSLMAGRSQHIETGLGEIRRIPLADGSLAAVNTLTEVEIALKPAQRHIVLARGEAWFQVAKDPDRPFVVEAGDVRVRAVGTAFGVQLRDNVVDVRVTEGEVEVWRVGDEANKKRVSAGELASLGQQGRTPLQPPPVETVEQALSWRDGQLVFDGSTVGEAAAQFNRYNQVKLEIADPVMAQKKMVGRFRTNEPQAFARAAAVLLDAKVDVRNDRIILSVS